MLAAVRAQIDVGDRALEQRQRSRASTPAASPTSVKTDRLCDASDEWSSSRTPGTARMASAIAATTSGPASFADVRHALDQDMNLALECRFKIREPLVDFPFLNLRSEISNSADAIIPAVLSHLPMSDPLRTDPARALDGAPEPDRDAKIEQLLLVGLDHYFAAEYEQAINVWTRALFLDRSHAARARLHRACAQRAGRAAARIGRAAAERRRGVSIAATATRRGGCFRPRSIAGRRREEALAVLDRLNRLEPRRRTAVAGQASASAPPPACSARLDAGRTRRTASHCAGRRPC